MMHPRRIQILILLVLFAAGALVGCGKTIPTDTRPPEAWQSPSTAASATAAPFHAGIARVNIVPNHPLPLSGYGVYFGSMRTVRMSQGVHDPLYATALYFEKGPDKLAVITYDLVGLVKGDVDAVREMVGRELGIDPERVIVSSSHTHHGPDTVGLWGTLFPPKTGRDEAYMDFVKSQGVKALRLAIQARRPAQLLVAVGEETELHSNIRSETDPNAPIDHILTVLALKDQNGKIFGTMTNWPCHPTTEGGDNRLISSDWVHYLRTELDKHYADAVHMYVNGAIGGAIQPRDKWRDEETGPDVEPFTWTEQMGTCLGRKVAGLVEKAEPVPFERIEVRHAPVRAYNHNWAFDLGRDLKILAMHMPAEGEVFYSQVTAVKMGSLRWGTLPGEVMPDISNLARAKLGGHAQIMVGLGQDWLGYVMLPKYYDDERYAYEKLLCVGPEFGANLLKTYNELTFE